MLKNKILFRNKKKSLWLVANNLSHIFTSFSNLISSTPPPPPPRSTPPPPHPHQGNAVELAGENSCF
jgi:hypothetical protein